MAIYLIDSVPQYCPECGRKNYHDVGTMQEFFKGASYFCPRDGCKTLYQYLSTEKMEEAAHLNPKGDLRIPEDF